MALVGVVPAAALVVGSFVGATTELDGRSLLWCLGCVLLIAILARGIAPRVTLALLTGALMVAGAALAARARDDALHTPLRRELDAAFGQFALEHPGPEGRHEPVPARFVLTEDASRFDDIILLRASAIGVRLRESWQPIRPTGTRLTVAGSFAQAQWTEWRAGRTIVAPVTFRRPARYLNDGVPDFERALALDGTSLLGTVKSGLLVQVERDGSMLDELAAAARAHVRRVVTRRVEPYGAVAGAVTTAVLVGDRTGLPDDVRTRLQEAGVYHVIAISGGNIAILAGLALLALAVLGVRGGPAAGVTLLVVLAFSLIVTAGPSVWRATLMAIVTLAARAIDHRTPSWHAVAVAAGAMVVARPLDVTNPGFILTFGATVALVEAARRVRLAAESPAPIPAAPTSRRRVRAALRLTWTQWVLPSIAASAAVELVLMPVSAHAFSRITVAGLVLNLTAVPLMALVQSAGLALSIADRWPIVAEPAAWVAARGASALVESARLVDVMPWLAWRVPPPSPVVMVVYYAGLGVWLFATGGRRLAGGLVLGITALAIAGGATWPSASARHQATMRLTVFDVGQAEALLLEVPDAEPMVVDAGGAPFGNPGSAIGSRVLAPALWARGITAVHTLLVTHGDPDHLGGAGALIGDFAPARLWTGIDVPSHRPMQDLLEQARRRGVAPTALRAGDVHEWGRARIRVLHPPEPDWERPRVRNDDSVVIEVLYDDTAVLLTGDVGQDVERAVLPQLSHARHRILKVAHHGSRTSTSQELLDGWRPGIAVISCGRGNRFGHPAAEVIARLQASGARVLRTDRDGQITIESDGRSVRVRTFMERAR